MAQVVDFAAREIHFLDHLAPVWRALPPEHRGRFYVTTVVAPLAAELDLDFVVTNGNLPGGDLVVVSSVGDLRRIGKRPAVLMQHGAGQSYSTRHPSYPGGHGYGSVVLFVNPNEGAAARNRRYYPRARQAVVGCPKLDRWHQYRDSRFKNLESRKRPLVAVSFHWPCRIALEAGTVFDDFGPELLAELVAHRDAGIINILGHGHPKIIDKLRPHYERHGIPIAANFDEVLARADLYVVDNSSTLFEFASLGRPVVVVNSPRWRRTANHGLRFWEAANIGPNVDHPSELRAAIALALAGGDALDRNREHAVTLAYAHHDGTASRRASMAIVETLGLLGRPTRCPVCNARACSCGAPSEASGIDIVVAEKNEPGSPIVYHFARGAHPQTRTAADFRLRLADARRLGVEPKGDALPVAVTRRLARKQLDPAALAALYLEATVEARRALLHRIAATSNDELAALLATLTAGVVIPTAPEDERQADDLTSTEAPPVGRVGDVITWVNKADTDEERHARAHAALAAEDPARPRQTLVATLERILEE